MKLIINLFVMSIQLIALYSIYYQVTKRRLQIKEALISVILLSLSASMLGGYWIIAVFPLIYIFSMIKYKSTNNYLNYFYSIYTCFVTLFLSNLINLLIYEMISVNLWEQVKFFIAIFSVLIPILVHFLILRLFNTDFRILESDDPFINNKIILPSNTILTIFFTIFLLIYFFEIFIGSWSPIHENTKYIFFIYIFMFLSLVIFVSIQTKNYLQMQIYKSKEREFQQLTIYTNKIEDLYKKIRGFRHDYANMLISLQESIQTNNIAEIHKVYTDVLVTANIQLEESNYNIAELTNIKDTAIKSIISTKLIVAESKGIIVNLEIKDIIDNFSISSVDLVRVLSIFLDNAIEAAIESSHPKINIAFFKHNSNVILIVQNTVITEAIPLNKIFSADFSTKGNHRGSGLYNIYTILQNYSNISLDTAIDNGLFTQTLYIKE
ncbi:sensor histidine kinase [Listeria booriae]|uniref:sensor histidine kinase n=1 Tax=Listeria booriae TaxID=1552123 RepID=UPI0016291C5F|nr:GHKL domain-containing protein [Listeria booriae]MBC2187736.1 GHKL domain-containing protein [Listeria booriae]